MQPAAAALLGERAALLGGQVGDDEAIAPRIGGRVGCVRQPVPEEGVVVAHEDHGRIVVVPPDVPGCLQAHVEGDALPERVKAGPLDGGAFCQRVAERHAQLEHFCARIQECPGDAG